jgi:hypothetical protein
MKHYLKSEDARCDGQIYSDQELEYCQRRESCQRYIAHKTDPSNKMAAWLVPLRNCNKFVEAKNE